MLLGHNSDDISLFLAFTLPELLPELLQAPVITIEAMHRALPRLFPHATQAQILELRCDFDPWYTLMRALDKTKAMISSSRFLFFIIPLPVVMLLISRQLSVRL